MEVVRMGEWKIAERYIDWQDEFDSSHFLMFDYESKCRRLHGHTFKVEVRIWGGLNDQGVIYDFNHLKELTKALDHKVFVPKDSIIGRSWSGRLRVKTKNDDELSFRSDEVVVFDFDNPTSERLAEWFANEIVKRAGSNVRKVQVCVWEDPRSRACVVIEKEGGDE